MKKIAAVLIALVVTISPLNSMEQVLRRFATFGFSSCTDNADVYEEVALEDKDNYPTFDWKKIEDYDVKTNEDLAPIVKIVSEYADSYDLKKYLIRNNVSVEIIWACESEYNNDALKYSLRKKKINFAYALIDYLNEKKAIETHNINDVSPLCLVILYENKELFDYLVKQIGVSISDTPPGKSSPILYAASCSDPYFAEKIIEKNSKALCLSNNDGNSPLAYALQKCSFETALMILEKIIDHSHNDFFSKKRWSNHLDKDMAQRCILNKNSVGDTALHIACRKAVKNVKAKAGPATIRKIIKLLLECGALKDDKNKAGESPRSLIKGDKILEAMFRSVNQEYFL